MAQLGGRNGQTDRKVPLNKESEMQDCVFKWVQLSDIHFRTKGKESFNSGLLKERLLRKLNELGDVDALLVTGDFRYAPDEEDNPANAADYLKKIVANLGIDMSKALMVPGNHDLKRGEVRTAAVARARSRYSPTEGTFNGEILDSLQKDFDFFRALKKEVGQDDVAGESNPHALADMGACCVLLLNTAITACGDNDEHSLLVGSNYLRNLLQGVRKPVIAMGHHGFELLRDEEKRACAKYLETEGVHLYLCGHSHIMWETGFGGDGKQMNVGCLIQEDKSAVAGFSVGSLSADGTVRLNCYVWDGSNQRWECKSAEDKVYSQLYGNAMEEGGKVRAVKGAVVTKAETPFTLEGYTLLGGRGIDGIKYHWRKDGKRVESLAFNRRLKDSVDQDVKKTSAYTISASYGCQLSATGMQCIFCETGKQKYNGNLHAEEMALQGIFMAEYDGDCPSFEEVRGNKREFAYMGQGEPGLNYPAVRQSILLTDRAMSMIHQTVSRHIISTCGISEFMPSLIDDIKCGFYKSQVTLHFSLNTIGEERNLLMPINQEYDYTDFIKCCLKFREVSGEKIGVGILMFNEFHLNDRNAENYTLTPEKLEQILEKLDKDIFRIDLCDMNKISMGKQTPFRNEDAKKLCEVFRGMGFEGKTFSSFGDNEQSGCGMLNSNTDAMNEPGAKTIEHFNAAVDLLNRAKEEIRREL